jgi:hypothetical protein
MLEGGRQPSTVASYWTFLWDAVSLDSTFRRDNKSKQKWHWNNVLLNCLGHLTMKHNACARHS